jgi:uroporphyrin-III C-methyltransferase
MNTIRKKTLKYTIINGDFSKRRNITKETLALILTANALVFDEYINLDFLNDMPLRPTYFYKVNLNEFYDERMKHINDLVVQLAYRFGHVVHLRGLNHLFFDDVYPSLKHARTYNIATKTLNLNFIAPELVLN